MVVEEQTMPMPKWWYRQKRPPDDNVYFENMSRIIFHAGLNWGVIDAKWPPIKKAFKDFNIQKVARFTENDVQRLLKDKSVIRHRAKIIAVILNARKCLEIQRQYGSLQSYIAGLDKSNNYANAVKELGRTFKRLAPSSAGMFLYTVGENIRPWDY